MSKVIAKPVHTNALLACVLTGVFMAILDVAIVNVALPVMQASIHSSGAQLQLVVVGYIATYAALLITGARLGDMFGYRKLFLIGVAIFTAASLACGLAPSSNTLISFRIVQGAGAALMIPQVLSFIQKYFVDIERARALGVYATVIGGGAIAGQVIGGVLVNANVLGLQWRPIFLVNVPIGAVLWLASKLFIPSDSGRLGRQLDLPGVVVLSFTILALVVPLTLGREWGWPEWMWGLLACGLVAMLLFRVLEKWAGQRGGQPLVHGRLLQAPGFMAGTLAILVAMGGYGGILFLLTLYVQKGLKDSPLVAGLVFLPSAVAFAMTSLNWRRLPTEWHRRMIPIGLLISSAALVALAWSLLAGKITLPMEFAIFCFGGGMGVAFSPLFTFALAHIKANDAADASGVLATVNQLGQVIGVAVYGALLLNFFRVPADAPHAGMLTALAMSAGAALAAIAALFLPKSR